VECVVRAPERAFLNMHCAGRFDRLESCRRRRLKKTQGEKFNQSNNHPKLTDSNNCLLFSFSCRLIAFVSTSPPPCVFFSPPARGMSLLGDRADVNCVTDKCASPLRYHEFLPLELRLNTVWNGSRSAVI
jgi:hypothetical protein